MTTSIELKHKLRHIKEFIGTFPRDKLPNIKSYPVSLIVNTDTSNGQGEHIWVAIHINERKFGEYFDSYGLKPLSSDITDFMDNFCVNGWTYNTEMIKGLTSINCGQFCVIFIYLKSERVPMFDIIKLFSNNHDVNDNIVKNLYKGLN